MVLSAICLAWYICDHRDKLRRSSVRTVAAFVGLSLFYDLVWYFVIDPSSEAELDGSLDTGFRSFLALVSWVSFYFRIVVFMTLWKVSLEFVRVMKQLD